MSLSEVMADAMSRAYSGFKDLMSGIPATEVKSGIKTCVRFYDTDDSLLCCVQDAKQTQKRRQDLMGKYPEAAGLRRLWIGYQIVKTSERVLSARDRERTLVVKALEAHVRRKQPVGVETFDHRYRSLRDDERHELLESVHAAKSMWLFLFAYNADLFADNNKGIAYFM